MRRFLLLPALLLGATTVFAQETPAPAAAPSELPAPAAKPAIRGDAEAGKIKAYTCTGCHGIPNYRNAYPNYRVPRLGGQHYDYLMVALKAYQAGERKHPTMRAQAESMSEQDMADIATYLSSVKYTEGAE
jgi:cytochrome c553